MKQKVVPMEELYPIIKEQLEAGGQYLLPVTGCSMLPALRQGRDSVILRPPARLKRRDIILYRRQSGQYVLHRIIRQEGEGFLCCGDNQFLAEYVAPKQILAVVSAIMQNRRQKELRSLSWQLWSCLWTALFPVRRPLIRLRRAMGQFKRRWKI